MNNVNGLARCQSQTTAGTAVLLSLREGQSWEHTEWRLEEARPSRPGQWPGRAVQWHGKETQSHCPSTWLCCPQVSGGDESGHPDPRVCSWMLQWNVGRLAFRLGSFCSILVYFKKKQSKSDVSPLLENLLQPLCKGQCITLLIRAKGTSLPPHVP